MIIQIFEIIFLVAIGYLVIGSFMSIIWLHANGYLD